MNQQVTIVWGKGAATEDVYRKAMMASAANSEKFNRGVPPPRTEYREPTKSYPVILRGAAQECGFTVNAEICEILKVTKKALGDELSRLVCKSLIVAEKDNRGRNSVFRITDEGRRVLAAAPK